MAMAYSITQTPHPVLLSGMCAFISLCLSTVPSPQACSRHQHCWHLEHQVLEVVVSDNRLLHQIAINGQTCSSILALLEGYGSPAAQQIMQT